MLAASARAWKVEKGVNVQGAVTIKTRLSLPQPDAKTNEMAHPEATAVSVAHGKLRHTRVAGSRLDLEAVLVGARGEDDGDVGLTESGIPGEDVGKEHRMEVADVGS